MYDIRLINPLRQYGTVCWTLLFSDPTGSLPSLRVEKKYHDVLSVELICDDIRNGIIAMIYSATQTEGNGGIVVDLNGETIIVDDVGGETYQWQI